MIKRFLAVDGIAVIAQFRDDGKYLAGYGVLDDAMISELVDFAYGYKRITQSHVDQLSMFSGAVGWTPPKGWMVKGKDMTVCSVGNLVCLAENKSSNLTEVMSELRELARFI